MTSRLLLASMVVVLSGCPIERFSIPEVVRSGDVTLQLTPGEQAEVVIRTRVFRQDATAWEFRFAAKPEPVGSYEVSSNQ